MNGRCVRERLTIVQLRQAGSIPHGVTDSRSGQRVSGFYFENVSIVVLQ